MNSAPGAGIRVLFFAKARELAGLNETTIEVDFSKTYLALDLLGLICERFNLTDIKDNIILAINENYCDSLKDRVVLKAGDEIAIIPPLSGG